MAEGQGGKKNRKLGRCKNKCAAYRAAHTMERNKVKRVLQSNGYAAAVEYARVHGVKEPGRKTGVSLPTNGRL